MEYGFKHVKNEHALHMLFSRLLENADERSDEERTASSEWKGHTTMRNRVFDL